jgi:hypothetical protein
VSKTIGLLALGFEGDASLIIEYKPFLWRLGVSLRSTPADLLNN